MNHLLSIGVLFLSALPALAQPWDIVRATYGNRGTWIDVSDRVRTLARGETLQFSVGADSLGTDPLPGVVKTLQISVRDAGGRSGQFSFRDGEQVNLQVRAGGGGSKGPILGERGRVVDRRRSSLTILSADYGDGRRSRDVTQTLSNAISGDQLQVQVTNSNMGGDPAPAAQKQLRVRYQYNGREYDATVRENDWLRLPDTGGSFQRGQHPGQPIARAPGDARRVRRRPPHARRHAVAEQRRA